MSGAAPRLLTMSGVRGAAALLSCGQIDLKSIGQDDAVDRFRVLARDNPVAHVGCDRFRDTLVGVAPASSATALEHERLAALEGNVPEHLRKPSAVVGKPADG